jgi:hypothetical protein
MLEGTRVTHTIAWCGVGSTYAMAWCGQPLAPSGSPSDFVSCREKYEVLASFRPIPRIFPV